MATEKLRNDSKGYYIVNQMPDEQMGGNDSLETSRAYLGASSA